MRGTRRCNQRSSEIQACKNLKGTAQRKSRSKKQSKPDLQSRELAVVFFSRPISYLLSACAYSGCQKNVAVFKRFFSTTTYTAIPSFGTLLWKAVYSVCQKNVAVFKRFFSTTTYTAIPSFGTLLW